jgi:serine/threonine protein kinase
MLHESQGHFDGKYEILEKIREGGMGAIYKVRHRLLGEIRVIKVMRPQLAGKEELRARFLREAQVAIKLRHPCIAQVYDFATDSRGTAFIVMEFIHGRTLDSLLRTYGPPSLGLAVEIAQQSLRALAYLHDKEFVHRDISPDNVMLTEDAEGSPQVKLIDLGIARVMGGAERNLTQIGTFLGKVRYAAPEQFNTVGAAGTGASGDLYSFGAVLYELLTGRHAIAGDDSGSIIAGHLFRGPVPFAETDPGGRVPAALRQVVLKALATSPADRFANARDFSRELGSFRVSGDLPLEEWTRLPRSPEGGEARPPAHGSSQVRLDEQFGLVTTPNRGGVSPPDIPLTQIELTNPAQASRPALDATLGEAALTAAVQRVEAELARGDLPTAAASLAAAEASLGEQPLLRALHGRLAMRRRADQEFQLARDEETARTRSAAAEAELAALCGKARHQIEQERWKEAGRLLRLAEAMAPDDAAVRQLQAELAASLKRKSDERRGHPADQRRTP